MRLAPASSRARTSARVRMPPEALTPQRPPATPRSRATSAGVAPPVEKPVEVLMKSAPAWMAISAPRSFSSTVSRAGLQNDLEQGAVVMGDGGDGVNGVMDGMVVAAFELADGNDHIQFAGAQAGERGRLLAQRGDQRGAQGKADDHAHRNAGSGEHGDRGGGPDGVDHGAGKAVADGLVAEILDLLAGGVGLQQGVVDDGGQRLPVRQRLGGKGSRIEAAVVEFKIGFLDG